jgi:5-methylcytosine-specific restriction endonuclease McrA
MEEKLKQMEQYLNNERQTFIEYKDFIDVSTFQRLKDMMNSYSKNKVKECFERTDIAGKQFDIEYPCVHCLKPVREQVSKSKLFSYLECKEVQLCYDCKEEDRKKERERLNAFLEKQREENIKLNNQLYDFWLSPDALEEKQDIKNLIYSRTYDIKGYLQLIIGNANKWELRDYVNNQLSYKMFLTTPYWKEVSQLAKRKAKFSCQLCGSKENLNVHHKTYEHKGTEINHLEDLIVLCQNCHSKFHEVK